MVGFYTDSPSWRVAYDEDGTQGYKVDYLNAITDLASGDLVKLNNDSTDSVQGPVNGFGTGDALVLIFPCLMDVDALFAATTQFGSGITYNRPGAVKTSVDTTNGVDGTWVTQSVGGSIGNTGKVAVRENIVSSTWGGIRAIKLYGASSGGGYNFMNVHVYGEPTTGQTLDRLVLWHPTLDQRVSAAYFDWGDVPRGSSADKTFRVKNLSATLTANAPRISLETLDDTSPSVPGYHTLSKGSGFASQQTLANLAPGAISGEICTIRRTTPSNAILGLWDLRIQAEATSWS